MTKKENIDEILKDVQDWEFIQDNVEFPKQPKVDIRKRVVSNLETRIKQAETDIETLRENIETYRKAIGILQKD